MPLGHTVSIREMLSSANADEEPTTPPSVAEPSKPEPAPSVPPAPEPAPAPEAPPKPEGWSKFEAQLLKDVDTTGWNESQVSQFLKARKNLEKGWHGSQAKYAEALRLAEALQQAGLTVDDLNETITRKKSGTNGVPKAPEVSPQTEKVLVGVIDRLIEEETDPATREQLRRSKVAIEEVSGRVAEERIQSRLKPMEEKVSRLESLASSYRAQESDAEIDALEDTDGYPASLVEKYRDQMRSYAHAYPQVSMKRILYLVASPEEIESAIAPERPEQKKSSASKPSAKPPTVSSANEGEGDLEAFKTKKGAGGQWKTRELMKHYLGKVLGE